MKTRGGGGGGLHSSISCPPLGALIEKFWVALLVCFGGLWWVLSFGVFPRRRGVGPQGESSDVGARGGGHAECCLQSSR